MDMRSFITVLMGLAILSVALADLARGSGGPPAPPPPPDTWRKLIDAVNRGAKTNSGDVAARLNAAYDQTESLANARTLLGVLRLPCEVANVARLDYDSNVDVQGAAVKDPESPRAVTEGKMDEVSVFGKLPKVTGIYEVACDDGTGYILAALGPGKPLAVSCIAADATHTTDVAQGVNSKFYCDLPANKDVKAMATKLMSLAGKPCVVIKLHWMGVDEKTQTEYSEVACADGNGYLMKTPLRLDAQISAIGCHEAIASGLKCLLTDSGPAPAVTMQLLLDTLKRNGVNCEPDQMRYIGRESIGRRYVVEIMSPERPNGLVSFIPIQDATKPFETIDCRTAAAKNIQCKLKR